MSANLSVIITNYCKPPEQIIQCVNSIISQTVQPKEIILVDDHSKTPYAHAQALSILLPKNMGVSLARDVGVKMSSGKLLLFVDADDVLAPDFIQQCGKQILKADVVYPNMLFFGEVEKNKLQESPSKLTSKYILGKTCAIPVTSMMWRHVYDTLGGFRVLPVFEDWDFWIRAMAHGYKFRRANTLLWYRQTKISRNHKMLQSIKDQVFIKMTAPYEIVDGKVQERKYGQPTA